MTTTQRLITLSRRIAELQAEFVRLKEDVRYSAPGVTLYWVCKTTVKHHTRRAFRAVRVNGRATT